MWPGIIEDPQLNEEAELVRPDPFPDDLVLLEMHDGDHPFLHCPSGGGPSHIAAGVGAAECHPGNDGVAGCDDFVHVQTEIRERLVVEADRLDFGRGTSPKRVDVVLAVEVGSRFVVSAIPDLVDKTPYLLLALGTVHGFTPFSSRKDSTGLPGSCNVSEPFSHIGMSLDLSTTIEAKGASRNAGQPKPGTASR